jgi:hypothetical protein
MFNLAIHRICLHSFGPFAILNIHNVATRLPFSLAENTMDLLAMIAKMIHSLFVVYKIEFLMETKDLQHTFKMESTIDEVLAYLKTFLGVPYRWHRAGDAITADEPFYAGNGPAHSREYIDSNDKSIVCTGLANLARRFRGLPIPGLYGSLDDEYVQGSTYPGTTGTWFAYLNHKGVLEALNVERSYPKGTLVLRDFSNIDTDQGHVGILIDTCGSAVLDQTLLHAYAELSYNESIDMKNVGQTGLMPFKDSHLWNSEGYYTHICLPEHWLGPAT